MGLDATVLCDMNLTEDSVRTAIVESTSGVFSSMVMLDATAKCVSEPLEKIPMALTSMVGFAGTYSGILSIQCPIDLALCIASSMLGEEMTEMNDDVNDAMGEIANMIGGDVKNIFSPGGGGIGLSMPAVTYGSDYSISNAQSLTIQFSCREHPLLVSVKVRK